MDNINSDGTSLVGKIAKMSSRLLVSLISVIVSFAVFLRFIHDTAVEAKAIAVGVRDDQRTMESRITTEVISNMVIINNQNQEFMRNEFGKMDAKLNAIRGGMSK